MTMGIWYEAMMRWFGPAKTVQALRTDESSATARMKTVAVVPPPFPDHIDITDVHGVRRNNELHHHERSPPSPVNSISRFMAPTA